MEIYISMHPVFLDVFRCVSSVCCEPVQVDPFTTTLWIGTICPPVTLFCRVYKSLVQTSNQPAAGSERRNYYWILLGSFGSKDYDQPAASDFSFSEGMTDGTTRHLEARKKYQDRTRSFKYST